MKWLTDFLQFVQHHAVLYVVAVGLISGIVTLIIEYLMKKSKKFFSTFILCFLGALIPLAISVFYPHVPEPVLSISNSDGYLKLSFFNGKFAFRNSEGMKVHVEDDVCSPVEKAYLSDSIAPLVYITILDSNDQVIYDDCSEHMESCLIGVNYGTYKVIASCDGYQKYTTTLLLTPDNKSAEVWLHKIHFIPNLKIASDLKIQVVDESGKPYRNVDVSIGYSVYTLETTLDENGIIDELFTLAEGEYLISIDENNAYGRFVINNLTDDNSTIIVPLTDSMKPGS